MGRSGQRQAERLQPGRGFGRARAAPGPRWSPAGTGTQSGTSGLGKPLGLGRETPYLILFRFGLLSFLVVRWEVGLPLGFLFFGGVGFWGWFGVWFFFLFRKCQSEIFQLSQPHTSFFLSKFWLKLFVEFCLYLPTVSVNLVLHFSSKYLDAQIYAALLLSSHCRKNAEKDCLGIYISMNSLEERGRKKPEEKNIEKQR